MGGSDRVGIPAMSDIRCLVSTGGEVTTRALYTAGLELSLVISDDARYHRISRREQDLSP